MQNLFQKNLELLFNKQTKNIINENDVKQKETENRFHR